jgi:hypothetical protein
VARLLLGDRRVGLAWERYGSGKVGPDFTLTIPGLRPVNIELTRMRRAPERVEAGVPWLAKLRQLPPGMPNAVVVAIGGNTAMALDIAASTRLIRARADAKDEPFFTARGFAGSRAFYGQFLRLGAVLVWCEDGSGGERVTLWRNGSPASPFRRGRSCMLGMPRRGTDPSPHPATWCDSSSRRSPGSRADIGPHRLMRNPRVVGWTRRPVDLMASAGAPLLGQCLSVRVSLT